LKDTKQKQVKSLVLFLIFSAAGFLNGYAGAGGGMVTGVLLPLYFGEKDRKTAFAYTALAVLLYSTVSATAYLLLGRLPFRTALINAFPALLGGALGGFLLRKINPALLQGIFAVLLIYSGVRFLWGS
jgi:uncharacterized membrane protein YfcA